MDPQSSNSNPWFAVSMGLLGLIIGYALATGMQGVPAIGGGGVAVVPPTVTPPANDNVPVPPPSNAEPAKPDDDAVLGKADAKITVIEFTDYQCPFCSRHHTQTFGQIKKDYIDTGKVKYIVRDYPLGFHPNAQKSAEAAECAGDQNKYFEMHDKLFETQQAWSNMDAATASKTFKQYAADLKLNTGNFDNCLDTGKQAAEVKKDQTDGSNSGIDGTPGFWILGPNDQKKQISGAYPYATFQAAFDEMLK